MWPREATFDAMKAVAVRERIRISDGIQLLLDAERAGR
jgi:hypothetical protein